ncbi:MAG: aromatic aminobenezylarsenical efflux permease ArsG family transporter [Candidatus Marinimicrobia bacterium]|nr:aromatic aminobenezylarsenical efflux permease ArsG family transporter [Candidatus Neomarinimicrobiota bacterium]
MEVLQAWLDSTNLPLLSAFILGLMTAISPCPLATNITAIAFIGKDIENRPRVFFNGLIYTLGRATTYTGLGLIFYFTASQFHISRFIQQWGERLLGPLLIIIGIFMLDIIKIKFPGLGKLSQKLQEKSKSGYWGVFLLGMVFALAFCPYSGVLYFGMLIPMTISSPGGLYLPLLFAIGTGLPVIIFAWIIAFTIGGIGRIYDKIKTFEKIFRKIVAVLFLLAGIYFVLVYYL